MDAETAGNGYEVFESVLSVKILGLMYTDLER